MVHASRWGMRIDVADSTTDMPGVMSTTLESHKQVELMKLVGSSVAPLQTRLIIRECIRVWNPTSRTHRARRGRGEQDVPNPRNLPETFELLVMGSTRNGNLPPLGEIQRPYIGV
jgi:hypothetical protein